LVSLFVIYYLYRFLIVLTKSHGHILRWHKQKRFVKAHSVTGAGLLALEEAEWALAESLLVKGASSSNTPVVNFINAARAAHEKLDYRRRDKYIKNAYERAEKQEKLAVALSIANMQVEHHQYTEALNILKKVHDNEPKHPYVLRLLKDCYLGLKRWQDLLPLLPALKKHKALDDKSLRKVEQRTYEKIFRAENDDIKALIKIWEHMPKELQIDPVILKNYCCQLIKLKGYENAEKIIERSLKSEFYPELVTYYSKLNGLEAEHRLKQAEKWLQKYGENTTLLKALSRIAISAKAFEQARDYAKKSLLVSEEIDVYILLALAYQGLGDDLHKQSAMQKAIALL